MKLVASSSEESALAVNTEGAPPEPFPESLLDVDQTTAVAQSGLVAAQVQAMIEQALLKDVRDTIAGRYGWRKISDWAEVAARTAAGAGAILSFAAGTFEEPGLAFSAGCVGTFAMVLGLWVNYANKESRERSRELNATLKTIGIAPLPDLASLQILTNAMNVYNRV